MSQIVEGLLRERFTLLAKLLEQPRHMLRVQWPAVLHREDVPVTNPRLLGGFTFLGLAELAGEQGGHGRIVQRQRTAS